MWHTYARRHNINQAYDRVKYFYRKELLDTGLQENDFYRQENKNRKEFLLMRETKTLILYIEVTDESIRTAEERENFFKGYINNIPGVKVLKSEII